MATDFPIFEEIKNLIYYNIETILVVIVPLAALIGWITERISKRLQSIKELNEKEIVAAKNRVAEIEKLMDERMDRIQDRVDKLSEKLNNLEVTVKVDLSIIKGQLGIK